MLWVALWPTQQNSLGPVKNRVYLYASLWCVYSLCTRAHTHTHFLIVLSKRSCELSGIWMGSVLRERTGLGQLDSFLHFQQTFIHFRWLCRSGQGLGYKDWAWTFPPGLGSEDIHVELGSLGEGKVERECGKG